MSAHRPYTVVVMRSERLGGDVYVADHVAAAESAADASSVACFEALKADKKDLKQEKPLLSDYHALVAFDGWRMAQIGQPRPEKHRRRDQV